MDLLEADLQEGKLKSGEELFMLHDWSDGGTKIISSSLLNDTRSAYGFYGNDGVNEIAIELGATYGARLYVATKSENNRHANIEIESSTYSFDEEESRNLNIQSPHPKGAIGYVKSGYILKTYEIGLPKELASHSIRITGDGVIKSENFIDKLENEKYRYIIKFKIDEHPYNLDVEFKYNLYRKFHISIPGTP
jgi:hypothetical protein